MGSLHCLSENFNYSFSKNNFFFNVLNVVKNGEENLPPFAFSSEISFYSLFLAKIALNDLHMIP